MTVKVTIVGGPSDGKELVVTDDRVRLAVQNSSDLWMAYTEEIGPSILEVVIPVRLTSKGYRAYWNERQE